MFKRKRHKSDEVASIVQQNIKALVEHRKEHEFRKNLGQKIADQVTRRIGSLVFVLIQLGFIILWILLNVHFVKRILPWDPFPFAELAMLAALESLFLSVFILVSQNRANELAERRADLDLQISLLSEHEITRLITLVDDMARQLNIKSSARDGLEELKRDVSPSKVIHEIEEAEKEI